MAQDGGKTRRKMELSEDFKCDGGKRRRNFVSYKESPEKLAAFPDASFQLWGHKAKSYVSSAKQCLDGLFDPQLLMVVQQAVKSTCTSLKTSWKSDTKIGSSISCRNVLQTGFKHWTYKCKCWACYAQQKFTVWKATKKIGVCANNAQSTISDATPTMCKNAEILLLDSLPLQIWCRTGFEEGNWEHWLNKTQYSLAWGASEWFQNIY